MLVLWERVDLYNGIINIYKERGFTSHDVVAKLRGILKQKKIGHTGTLDPQAQGVLPVCLGKATKVCDLLTDKDKVYEAVMRLGVETDTQDMTGEILNRAQVNLSKEQVIEAINSFVGDYEQIPPMYSALKVGGRKLCDLARSGQVIERQPRRVHIFDIEIINISLPLVTMKVHCSKGTYIRTLCNDIGLRLGCYGAMESLIRTKVSCFELSDSIKLSQVEKYLSDGTLDEYILPVDRLFRDLPEFVDDGRNDKLLNHGNEFYPNGNVMDGEVRVYNVRGDFIGIYKYHSGRKMYSPVKVFYDTVQEKEE
jgi:tRNA pseudouridine55 synthase